MLLWKRIFFASGLSIRWSTGDDDGLLLPWIAPPAALPGLAVLPNAPAGFGFNSKPLHSRINGRYLIVDVKPGNRRYLVPDPA